MRQPRAPGPTGSSPNPERGDEPDTGHDRDAVRDRARGLPVRGIVIAIVLVALVVALHLTGILGPGAH